MPDSRLYQADDPSCSHGDCELARFSAPSARLQDVMPMLLEAGRRVEVSAGTVLYREGEAIDAVLAIGSGLVKLEQYLPSGRARIVRLHTAGALLGLNGTLEPDHERTAIAVTDMEVLHVPLSVVRRLRSEEPTVYIRLLEAWNSYLSEADVWITRFSTGSIRARVARLVSFLAVMPEGSETDQGVVSLLTCEDMANILGVTPESVSRNLAEFKRQGVLDVVEGESERYACDLHELEALALE